MLAILSPTKTFRTPLMKKGVESTAPLFNEKTAELVNLLKAYSVEDLARIMKMSTTLAEQNYERFQSFETQAPHLGILAYHGEAFKALEAVSFSEKELQYAQDHLVILSGLYGAVRPLDEINEYRLEMAAKVGLNLYKFWNETMTEYIIEALRKSGGEEVLINLASDEYSKALDLKRIPSIQIVFKEGERVVGMYAKRARGLMARYIITNQIQTTNQLKQFNQDGYTFNESQSTDVKWVFTRG